MLYKEIQVEITADDVLDWIRTHDDPETLRKLGRTALDCADRIDKRHAAIEPIES